MPFPVYKITQCLFCSKILVLSHHIFRVLISLFLFNQTNPLGSQAREAWAQRQPKQACYLAVGGNRSALRNPRKHEGNMQTTQKTGDWTRTFFYCDTTVLTTKQLCCPTDTLLNLKNNNLLLLLFLFIYTCAFLC